MKLPDTIKRLQELSQNLWWSWDHKGRELFRMLDYHQWMDSRHNVVDILQKIDTNKLEEMARNPDFLQKYKEVMERFDRYMDMSTKWYAKEFGESSLENYIAYFSFEFGLHQSLPIYSGGLGVLAGDICKEASDLGIPFVAVGFFYKEGYFTQKIPPHGWQEAEFIKTDVENLAIELVKQDGKRLLIPVDLGDENIYLQIWKVNVGTVDLYLMDADVEENQPWNRSLTARLYGGDHVVRIRQELIMGVGGVRLLEELGIKPSVWHLNEGHCSFIPLERIVQLVKEGQTFEEAWETVRKSTVFTTHTPVPAGHDRFELSFVEETLAHKIDELGVPRERILSMGINPAGEKNLFNMTVFGFRCSHLVNAVSQLHRDVTEKMWKQLLDELGDKVKLLCVTNGVHLPTFISGPMRRLFSKYISPDWVEHQDDKELWKKAMEIPDDVYWETRQEAKKRLLSQIRETSRDLRTRGDIPADQVIASGALFDPEALTIGFARRFATYKRADLIFTDKERIRKHLGSRHKPLQIIFAGKAHPADEAGKHVLQNVYSEAMNPANFGRIAFVENYDMYIARFLVQGVDIWLNNPIRPHEASGTSGMKAAANGIPHFSTLDGWWAEGYTNDNGWVIGDGKELQNQEEQDRHDVMSLYELLDEITELYYKDRKKWLHYSKAAIRESIPNFSATRMMKDYIKLMYTPTIQ